MTTQQPENTHNKDHEGYEQLRGQVCDGMYERIDTIEQEFKAGFEFIKQAQRSVTIFGSARTPEDDVDYQSARELSSRIVKELDYAVLTGGGPGIMEAANRGAHEADGTSLGLTIELPFEQSQNPYLTGEQSFHYFFSRKVCLAFAAEAYVYYPGGFGTLDELFEILTLIQTKKVPQVPVYLVGSHFWNQQQEAIKEQLLAKGKISPEDLDLYTITDDLDEVIEGIKQAPVRHSKDA